MNFKPKSFISDDEQTVLSIVRNTISSRGIPPSQVEIFKQTRYSSVTTIGNVLKRLAQKGYIDYSTGLSRGARPVYSRRIPVYREEVGVLESRLVDSRLFAAPPHMLVELASDSILGQKGDLIAIHTPNRIERMVFGDFKTVKYCTTENKISFNDAYRKEGSTSRTLAENEGIFVGKIRLL